MRGIIIKIQNFERNKPQRPKARGVLKFNKKIFFRIKEFVKNNKYLIIIIFFALYYTLFVTAENISRIDSFQDNFGYDLAIYDQNLWNLKNFHDLFNTVRGLHMLGDHVPIINFFLFPFYYLWDSVYMLVLLQAVFVSSGSLILYLIGNKLNIGKGKSCLIGLLYLIYPATQYINKDIMFSDSFSVPLILLSFLFLIEKKYLISYIFAMMVMFCKEELALLVIAYGIYIMIKHSVRWGLITTTSAIIWLVIIFTLVLPAFNGSGYFRSEGKYSVFGNLGDSPSQAVKNVIIHPISTSKILFTLENINYFNNLFLPLAYIPLMAPLVLFIMLPIFLVNTLGGYYYTHFIDYHYVSSLVPVIFLALIFSIKKIKTNRISRFMLGSVILCVIIASVSIGPQTGILKEPNIAYKFRDVKFERSINRDTFSLIGMIPEGASVSAEHAFLPHLAHREKIYMFEVPFKNHYWGINGENLPTDAPEYLLLTNKSPIIQTGKKESNLYLNNRKINYEIIGSSNKAVLLRIKEDI